MNLQAWITLADTWETGGREVWQRIPLAAREEDAFVHCGCLYAAPTWGIPVHCLHLECKLRRGEITPADKLRAILTSERDNWLRGVSDEVFERLYAGCLRVAQETGEYDPWKLPGGWMGIVYTGLDCG
jgi:diadenosine tetraphosphatase ApaH/serine/threonine PP2A family protein phosphatase